MIRVLVTGSRSWENVVLIEALLARLIWIARKPRNVVLVHGACPRGADFIADQFARDVGMQIEAHPADWDSWGKSAGFRRNADMVSLGADLCLAFIRAGSPGASMTADLALKAGIHTLTYRER